MGFNRVMHYFREISEIPRGSGNTEKIADYCEKFAKDKALKYVRDDADNVVIYKKGKKNTICLQGHTDMVCEAEKGVIKDFLNEGIEIIEEDGWLHANKTTLGADNGVAISIILALLEDENEEFPSFEAVFTSNEEIGLLGANALDKSLITADMLINIDSEDEGIITAGCAGGKREMLTLPVKREEVTGYKYVISVNGLSGGHSGVEIFKNGANAAKLLGKLLRAVHNEEKSFLVSIDGGSKDNVIPPESCAKLIFKEESYEMLSKVCEKYSKLFSAAFKETDPNLTINIHKDGEGTENAFDFKALSEIICEAPNGVMEKNEGDEVTTSLNLGILQSEEECVKLGFGVRSSSDAKKELLCERLIKLAQKYGADSEESGNYPGWDFKKESELRKKVCEEYFKLTGKEAEVKTIHAGLECGALGEGKENYDAVSIGPDMKDIHTPRERVSIASFERTYELVKNVCRALI